uniref:Uncharacterized protein n=1 Tax=Geobacter sp. (strain M21) TaxID=443144 RepID=C6E1F6_GEOSM
MKGIIETIFKDHFGIDLKTWAVNFEVAYRKKNKDKFEFFTKKYSQHVAAELCKDKAKRRFYLDGDLFIYVQNCFPYADVKALTPQEFLLYPVCSIEEIIRMRKPSCASDLLLKVRSDAIADHPRITRVYLSRYDRAKHGWTLTGAFDDTPFTAYKDKLSAEHMVLCDNTPAGFVFITDPNGTCESTEFGNIIYISEALKHYLYYMNLFILCFKEISLEDRFNSFMIAVRTMLLAEALDFDLDSRGDLPQEIDSWLTAVVKDQLDFVIGHEYAHHLLGHLDGCSLSKSTHPSLLKESLGKYYNYDQRQEFDADFNSIKHAHYTEQQIDDVANAAIIYFIGLDLFDHVKYFLSPPTGGIKSHPDPIDRAWAIHNLFGTGKTAYRKDDLEYFVNMADELKSFLTNEFMPFNPDAFEIAGSVYLPSYRNHSLIDRIDF